MRLESCFAHGVESRVHWAQASGCHTVLIATAGVGSGGPKFETKQSCAGVLHQGF